MLFSHILKPVRISRIFVPGLILANVGYFLLYFLTPENLGFLGPAWVAHPVWLDVGYGCLLLFLNGHSYIDFFFGFNGGFSMSLMLEILRREPNGAELDEIVNCYKGANGFDKIYGWRLPRLADSGMIRIDYTTGTCVLTQTGRRVAKFALFCKRVLNLGMGG